MKLIFIKNKDLFFDDAGKNHTKENEVKYIDEDLEGVPYFKLYFKDAPMAVFKNANEFEVYVAEFDVNVKKLVNRSGQRKRNISNMLKYVKKFFVKYPNGCISLR